MDKRGLETFARLEAQWKGSLEALAKLLYSVLGCGFSARRSELVSVRLIICFQEHG